MEFLKDLVLFLAGLAFAGLGCHLLWGHYEDERLFTSQTPGVVSEVQEVRAPGKISGTRVIKYVPTFTYTVDGITYDKSTGVQHEASAAFPVGREVTVFYDPSNPEHFYVEEERDQPIGPEAFIAFGVIFMLATRPWRFLWRLRQSQ